MSALVHRIELALQFVVADGPHHHFLADDKARRQAAKVPDDIVFKTKNEIAIEQIEAACAAGLPRGVVLIELSAVADSSRNKSPARDG